MSGGWCCDSFQLPNCPCVCVVSLRKEAEDDEEAEEAAPASCSVCADGGCRWFSKVQGHPEPSRQASRREETAARDPRSKTHICGRLQSFDYMPHFSSIDKYCYIPWVEICGVY